MLYNLLVIWILLLIILFQGILKQNNTTKLAFLTLSGLSLALLTGFRFETSGDFYTNYVNFTKTASMSFSEILFSYSEFGHMLFRKVISLFTDNPQWYFLISGLFIIVSFLIYIYRYSYNIYLSVFLFVTIGGYFVSHNITRQYIAIAICLYAIPYLISRKPIKYLLIIVTAMTFHTSSFIMLPIYLVAKIPVKRNIILLYLIAVTLITLTFDRVFSIVHSLLYSEYYTEGSYGTISADILNIILPTFLLMFLLYFYLIWKNDLNKSRELCLTTSKEYILYNSMLHMGILSFFFSLLSITNMLILNRLSDFLMVCYLIIIPWALKHTPKKNRIIIYFVIFIASLTYFSINNYFGRLIPTPYTPFWLH